MCLACDMEAMWFAVMEARAAAGATAASDGPEEPATHLPSPKADDPLLPPPEEGGGGAPRRGERADAPRRFACEETPAE
jgi:hypothetical protein